MGHRRWFTCLGYQRARFNHQGRYRLFLFLRLLFRHHHGTSVLDLSRRDFPDASSCQGGLVLHCHKLVGRFVSTASVMAKTVSGCSTLPWLGPSPLVSPTSRGRLTSSSEPSTLLRSSMCSSVSLRLPVGLSRRLRTCSPRDTPLQPGRSSAMSEGRPFRRLKGRQMMLRMTTRSRRKPLKYFRRVGAVFFLRLENLMMSLMRVLG